MSDEEKQIVFSSGRNGGIYPKATGISASQAVKQAAILNTEQKAAADAVLAGKSIFITGPGGTGKSYLIRALVDALSERGTSYAVCALTGCAALQLDCGAKTLHSWAGVGLGREPVEVLVANLRKSFNKKALNRWKWTDVLIIDEVSMLTTELLEKLDSIGRIIRAKPDQPFGGIQVVFSGDFCQLPPVMKADLSGATPIVDIPLLFETQIWASIVQETIVLRQIHRQTDPIFHRILNEARMGALTEESVAILKSRHVKNFNLEELKIKPTLIFSRNAQVDEINDKEMMALDGDMVVRKAEIVYSSKVVEGKIPKPHLEDSDVKRSLLRLQNDAPFVPILTMKVGAQVMLISNLDVEKGLVNGSRGVIVRFTPLNDPVVLFVNGLELVIGTQEWFCDDYPAIGYCQIPLRIAFAITTHRSQGATLDCALIDIGSSTFEFGQAYVALSRIRSLEGLYIQDLKASRIKAHKKVVEFYQDLEAGH